MSATPESIVASKPISEEAEAVLRTESSGKVKAAKGRIITGARMPNVDLIHAQHDCREGELFLVYSPMLYEMELFVVEYPPLTGKMKCAAESLKGDTKALALLNELRHQWAKDDNYVYGRRANVALGRVGRNKEHSMQRACLTQFRRNDVIPVRVVE